MTLRVALSVSRPGEWTGGINYLLNTARVLRLHSRSVTPVMFAPHGIDEGLRRRIAEAAGSDPVMLAERPRRADNLAMLGFAGSVAARQFAAHAIDVVFESGGYYGPRPGFPVLSWLPDFQHRRLPHLFSRTQWLAREMRFRRILGTRANVLLSSQDARHDLESLYRRPRGTIHVVPFAVRLEHVPSAAEADAVRLRHGLPDRYFFLPNQFWAHKNHALVVEALGRLGRDAPVVAATGNPNDPRAPGLVQPLRERIDALGLNDRFRLLGEVPYADALALNARADAMVNPSRFEGWSTTVEEAKALGTPLLLSSLAVHREQAGASALYFDMNDPDDCARQLNAFRNRLVGRITGTDERTNRNEAAQRRYAEQLEAALESARSRQ